MNEQAGGGFGDVFRFFNEVGIIAQLSGALFNRVLPDGVHVAHFAIVNHLSRMGDGRTPHEIAAAMQVTKATMTHSLDVLLRRGFIRLAPHETDGRSKRVYLTVDGRRFREAAIASLAQATAGLFTDDHRQAMKTALPALGAVRKLLDENR